MKREKTALDLAFDGTRPALFAAFFISIFINASMFAVPLYSLQVFDRVLTSRNLTTLVMLTGIAGGFILLYGILEYVRAGILVRGANRFHQSLAQPVFDLALRASLQGRPAAGTLSLRDLETLRDTLSGNAVSSLFDVPWTPVFVGLCFLFHPVMGLVALAGALLILACAVVTDFVTRRSSSAVTGASTEAARFSASVLRQAETAKGLGMDSAVTARWADMQNEALFLQSRSSERTGMFLAMTKVIRLGVQIALIGAGAWLAIERLISPGVMMAAMIIMGRALAPVEQAVANWRRLTAAREASARLSDLFRSLPAPAGTTTLPEPTGDLDVEVLVLRAPRASDATVKDVSFSIPAGSAMAIVGPSGSGKSSLVKALAGVWQPVRGTVRLDGGALPHWNPDQLGRAIGYLPQTVEFLPGTVAENIARMASPNEEAMIEAARLAGVHEAILKLPKGYYTMLGDGETVLSGGMQQRIALARALYGDPCLVVLDEPNSNLDREGEAALARCLAALKDRNRTVVVVTHRPQLLAHVDSILVMQAGKVQRFGPRADVLASLQERSKISPVSARSGAVAPLTQKSAA